jgi:hypothetical protein
MRIEPHNKHRTDRTTKPRVYVWPSETVLEQLLNRRARPVSEYRKNILPEVLKYLNLPADTKVRWSQNAGCQCGCSPGFILNTTSRTDLHVYLGETA